MPGKQRKREYDLNEQERSQMEELKNQIDNLPKDNQKFCEGQIRELYKQISQISKESAKQQLLSNLRAVSTCGLNDELKNMVEDNGLHMEALHLVLNYLTTKEELGEYFFTHTKDDDDQCGLSVVRKRLGPKLEVLGGLQAKGIDIKKPWIAELVKEASSFQALSRISVGKLQELCNGAADEEREDVNRRVKIAESSKRQVSAGHVVKKIDEKRERGKFINPEKLVKAKALMNEVKEKAKEQSEEAKKAVNKKIDEITGILQLLPDWNKHDIPKDQLDSVVEVDEAYKSELEVVRKASGGRALCGIYYSENAHPLTAEIPIIIMPNELILSSPNNSQQVGYMKFSCSQDAERYVHGVKSSSSNIGLRVSGSVGTIDEDIGVKDLTSSEKEPSASEKERMCSATALQYIWIATKTFKIEQEQLKLSPSARRMVGTVVKDERTARLFMKRYGSHLPAGLHTLGGVLFRIATAQSKSIKETAVLSQKAAQQLQGQISVGCLGGMFGFGANNSEYSTSSSKTEGQDVESHDISYTFTFQTMGPATTNPATFNKFLTNNTTWALIDRGSTQAYLPVWELIRDLGEDFEEAAEIMERTWNADEAERKRIIDMRIEEEKVIDEQKSEKSKTRYISNITFVVSDSKVHGVPNMINVDMNCGSRGDYIYPVRHFSHNKNEAIAGLAFIQNNAIVSNGYTKINQDLNKGAGGTYNYLCITKVGENRMIAIDFIACDRKRSDKIINGYFRYPANLNTGASSVGKYVYLLYKTDAGKPFD